MPKEQPDGFVSNIGLLAKFPASIYDNSCAWIGRHPSAGDRNNLESAVFLVHMCLVPARIAARLASCVFQVVSTASGSPLHPT
jgi:hypothetical protein